MICHFWKFIFPVFVFLAFSFSSAAQEMIFQSTEACTFKIPYRFSQTGYSYENELLREIARDALKEPGRVKVQVNGDISLEIRKNNKENQLNVFFSRLRISGDTRYRHFNISDVLLPSRIKLKILWAKKNNLSLASSASFDDLMIKGSDGLLLTGSLPAFDPYVDTLFIRDAIFSYDSLDRIRFRDKIHLIRDYYASVAILDTLDLMLSGFSPEETLNLPLLFIQVEESDKILECIRERNFQEHLLKLDTDFMHFVERYTATNRKGRSVHFNFLDYLSASGAISWDGNLHVYTDYFTQRMLSFVRNAQLMGELQGSIYQDYLNKWFSFSVFPDDLKLTENILAKMYPDAARDTLVLYLSKEIYHSYEQLSATLIAHDQFAEAKALMDHAHLFRERNPYLKKVPAKDEILSKAVNGMYHSYIGIASGCIEARKPEMAEKYLKIAEKYRQQHDVLIQNDTLYRKVLQDLFFLKWNSYDRLSEDQNIRGSMRFAE